MKDSVMESVRAWRSWRCWRCGDDKVSILSRRALAPCLTLTARRTRAIGPTRYVISTDNPLPGQCMPKVGHVTLVSMKDQWLHASKGTHCFRYVLHFPCNLLTRLAVLKTENLLVTKGIQLVSITIVMTEAPQNDQRSHGVLLTLNKPLPLIRLHTGGGC